jgi:uncharacterized protein YcbK (DUF882 family)
MGMDSKSVGRINTLQKSFGKIILSVAVASSLLLGGNLLVSDSEAGGETRSISLYHVHTKENITVTYMQNGRYVPSAMKKINYLMRDWRRDQVVTIDPKTLDLMWELHEDLGSKRPIHIVCGFRSHKTNAFLRRIGRNVARESQHVKGKAVDFYFPDVDTKKIRNAALFRKIGGVGYYRSSGGPSGFLHVDSGKIRHWGPAISRTQMVAALSEGRKVAGRRLTRSSGADTQLALSDTQPARKSGYSLRDWFIGKPKTPAPDTVVASKPEEVTSASYTEANYEGYDDGLTDLAGDVVAEAEKVKTNATISPSDSSNLSQLASQNAEEVGEKVVLAKGYPVPRPRLKPIEIMMLAAADVKIIPASAPPETPFFNPNKDDRKKLASLFAREAELQKPVLDAKEDVILPEVDAFDMANLTPEESGQVVNRDGKSDFASELRDLKTDRVPLIRPIMSASLTPEMGELWDSLIVSNEATLRRNGTPPLLDRAETSVLPTESVLPEEDGEQTVNREGKGHMPRMTFKLSRLKQ